MWDICQKSISQKSLILQGTGNESRDFVHALDIARALNVICDRAPMQGEVYNLGSSQEVKISELADMLLTLMGSNLKAQFSGSAAIGNPINWQSDISKLNSLGFNPSINIDKGIKTFTNWCMAELVN